MSEFQDREKQLGDLPEDIMEERGEYPFNEKGSISPPNHLLKKDEMTQDQPVVPVFDVRSINTIDFYHSASIDIDLT